MQVGDTVKVDRRSVRRRPLSAAPVHSSVSGTVTAIENRGHATRGECLSVVIKSDGKNTLHESVKPHKGLEELTPDEIVEIVKEAGIVGMAAPVSPHL